MTLSHLPGPSPPPSSHFGPRERAIPSDITLRVPNGLIHRENEGSRLRGSSKGIGFHHGRLPDTRLKVVSNVLLVDVYTIPLESCETVTGIETKSAYKEPSTSPYYVLYIVTLLRKMQLCKRAHTMMIGHLSSCELPTVS